jgi:hypothetical protein
VQFETPLLPLHITSTKKNLNQPANDNQSPEDEVEPTTET